MARKPAMSIQVERHAVTADRGDDGVRLDLVLLRRVGARLALSRRAIQRSIENGDVAVNGVVATKTSARVALGDRIEAALPVVVRPGPPQARELPLDVVFEDEHLIAVNKPPGMVSHPSYKHSEDTLLNALLWHLRGTPVRPRLLGRLDKDTSGLVLVSKTRAAHAGVVRAMRVGAVRKEYLAVVHGAPRPARGDIALSLARDPSNVRRVAVVESAGKESVTRYETVATGQLRKDLNTAGDAARSEWLSLVRCELATGRMHQIRVHLAARGWPIVGDAVYGAARASAIARQALHAWRVSLPHPVTGDPLVIVARLPGDMQALLHAAALDERPTTSDERRVTSDDDQRPTTND